MKTLITSNMKREILFRGKRVDNGQWVEGSLIGEDVIVGNIVDFEEDYFTTEFWYRVDPETVGQFTGRYDKNDKEIFERDIVVNKNIHGKKWIVEYRTDSEYVGFVLKEIGTNGISLFTSWNDIEVIGNIHDNKEPLP